VITESLGSEWNEALDIPLNDKGSLVANPENWFFLNYRKYKVVLSLKLLTLMAGLTITLWGSSVEAVSYSLGVRFAAIW
jgi:hypothetical protein